MSTLHRGDGQFLLAVKGAPESILERSRSAIDPGGRESVLHDGERAALRRTVDEMAERGARVLALSYRNLDGPADESEIEAEEDGLTFVALAELRDPLREEAPSSVASARSAGIAILMVTGDHPGTARSIAGEVGIAAGNRVVTGRDLRDKGVPSDLLETPIYARVDPSDKLSLVEALKRSGHVTAVTGDGVNDAPALRRADIGVAMGRAGTDAAREAADMIVTDDNLATIVGAVREGRAIYDNIRKVVEYLVAANLSEIVVVVTALVLFPDLGVPLLPLQLLWINLVTDGLPAVALGLDPPDPHLMERRPRRETDRLLNAARLRRLLARAALLAAASLATLLMSHYAWGYSWTHARGTMFTALAASQLLYALAVRKPAGWKAREEGLLRTLRMILMNRWLLVGIACGLALQILVSTWAPLGAVFSVSPLGLDEWILVAAAAFLPSIFIAAALGYRRVE
jgi:Ca2+-transporting ATPase